MPVANGTGRFKRFPPGTGHVWVPCSSRRAGASGLSLYTPCRTGALLAHRTARAVVALFGARAIPGRSVSWSPPVDEERWHRMLADWRSDVGDFDGYAVYERSQSERAGIALLLLRAGEAVAFARVRLAEAESEPSELACLEAVRALEPLSFRAPRPIAAGFSGRWHYSIIEALAMGLHRPARNPDLEAIVRDVDAALSTTIGRPVNVSPHWRLAHGDLAPWNLRRLPTGGLALVDWESACWAPPHADWVFYQATDAALSGRRPRYREEMDEARSFWLDRIESSAPETSGRDERLRSALVAALRYGGRGEIER